MNFCVFFIGLAESPYKLTVKVFVYTAENIRRRVFEKAVIQIEPHHTFRFAFKALLQFKSQISTKQEMKMKHTQRKKVTILISFTLG